MPYPITLQAVARHLLPLTAAAIVFASCATVYELYAPPGATINPPRQGNYENPDNYRVDPASYPQYRAVRTFTPPSPKNEGWTSKYSMVEITSSDVWRVTHKVGDRIVIYSDTYQTRQCEYLAKGGAGSSAKKSHLTGKCESNYLYGLFILPNGMINRGWLLLHNPVLVVASRDRYVIMDPRLRESAGWPEDPLFVPIK